MTIRIEWKPRDLWVGAYWQRYGVYSPRNAESYYHYELWICLLPCIPIHLTWMSKRDRP